MKKFPKAASTLPIYPGFRWTLKKLWRNFFVFFGGPLVVFRYFSSSVAPPRGQPTAQCHPRGSLPRDTIKVSHGLGRCRIQSGASTTNPSQLLTARNLQNIVKTSDFRNLLMWAPSGFRRGLYFGPKTIFIPPPLSENDNFSPLASRDTIFCEPYRALCLDFSLSCIYLTLLLPIFSFKPLSSFSFLLSPFFLFL